MRPIKAGSRLCTPRRQWGKPRSSACCRIRSRRRARDIQRLDGPACGGSRRVCRNRRLSSRLRGLTRDAAPQTPNHPDSPQVSTIRLKRARAAQSVIFWRVVLDLAAPRAAFARTRIKITVVRIDLEPAGPEVPNFACADAARLPFRDHCFDLIVSNHSLEHFEDLAGALAEIGRVAKLALHSTSACPTPLRFQTVCTAGWRVAGATSTLFLRLKSSPCAFRMRPDSTTSRLAHCVPPYHS